MLSPILFALYLKELGDRLMDSWKGVIVDDEIIPGFFFADDMNLLAHSGRELQQLLDITTTFGLEVGLSLIHI